MANTCTLFGFVKKSGDTMTGNLAMGGNKVTGLGAAGASGDAARYEQLESQVHSCVRLAGDTMTGGLNTQALAATTGNFTDDVTITAGKTVDGRDISAMVRGKVKTGTYTGDGTDNRNIDIGVDLTAKSNVYVIVKGWSNYYPMHRIEHSQGDAAMNYRNLDDEDDCIQGFTSTGFQVGTDARVNEAAILFRYIVFYEEP